MAPFLSTYLYWHYQKGIKDSFSFSKNFLWFIWNFFSIGLLFKTLFSPFQRLEEHGAKGNLQSYFEAFIITTFMRLVGAFIRLIFIVLGLVSIVITFMALCLLEIIWFLFPVVAVGSLIVGLMFLFL